MVNAHLDILELELRKLDGVRTVGFSSQHDVLYIQLFIDSNANTATTPFEATRVAQRHSNSPVAVELVRWTNLTKPTEGAGLASIFADTNAIRMERVAEQENEPVGENASKAGSIGSFSSEDSKDQILLVDDQQDQEAPAPRAFNEDEEQSADIREEPADYEELGYPEIFQNTTEDDDRAELSEEDVQDQDEIIDLQDGEEESSEILEPFAQSEFGDETDTDRREDDNALERIALLLVTTSSENDEIEVHLAFDDLRTIGRAATNRGLLGAIDATVAAISELTGANDFHAEWARSLEPGAEHASLVAVGLTNSEGTDTRHGIAGGASPIEAAARATLNALNRTAVLAATDL